MVNDDVNTAILRCLATHRVATRPAVARLIPSGAAPDKRLRRLAADGLVRVNKRLPGNRSLYQLTPAGAAHVGVPESRARPMGPQAVLKHLGILLFCEAKPEERFRVEPEELAPLLGTALSDGAHCLCRMGERTVVLRCYVPARETPLVTVVRRLRRTLRELRQSPQVAEFIRDGRYGFAVVVDNPSRRRALMDAVRTPDGPGRKPLLRTVRVWVEAIPELAAYVGGTVRKAEPAASPRPSLFDEEDKS